MCLALMTVSSIVSATDSHNSVLERTHAIEGKHGSDNTSGDPCESDVTLNQWQVIYFEIF